MSACDESSRVVKPGNWVREFHRLIWYQYSSGRLVDLMKVMSPQTLEAPQRTGGLNAVKAKNKVEPVRAREAYVRKIQTWEQTQNAYLNVVLRLLPSEVMKEALGLHSVTGELGLADLGIDANTVQADSVLLSEDCACMIEIKTNAGAHFSLQQIVKYLHAIAVLAHGGRHIHRLFLLSPNREISKWWVKADRQIVERGDWEAGGGVTLADLGLTFDGLKQHLHPAGQSQKSSATARDLLARHRGEIEPEIGRTAIRWLDWDTFLLGLQNATKVLPDSVGKQMCDRLVADFVQWNRDPDGRGTDGPTAPKAGS